MGILEFLILILVAAWLLGVGVLHVGGGLIHLLIVVAVIVLIYRLLKNKRV
jgi:hypothetical protein